jgi:hypothetical protein
MRWTVFEYAYRDAGNYKAFGTVYLSGELTVEERQAVTARFESETFFVAEQLEIPTLYDELYRWSSGPTEADHCWHSIEGFDLIDGLRLPADAREWGAASDFYSQVDAVKNWDGSMSPHYAIG